MATISYADIVITPQLVLGYEWASTSRNVIHDILDNSTPVVTLKEAGSRKGTLNLFFLSEAEGEAAAVALRVADVFNLTDEDRPTANMRFVANGDITSTLDPETRDRWFVSVAYREV